jgi:hypothetical protein
MSRRRYLSTEISIDTAVNRLARSAGDFAVMLYTWMIPHCDDDGIVHGDAEEIILQVIPGRRDKKIEDVTAALSAMQEHGLIEWDQEARCVIFPATSFYKYQTYIKPERRRGATGAEQNNAPEVAKDSDNAANQRKSAQNTVSVKHSHSLSHSEKKQPTVEPTPLQAQSRDVFAALLFSCGYDLTATLSKPERDKINGAVKAIVSAGGDGVTVKERAETYRRKYPDVVITPPALASHWGELASDVKENTGWKKNGFKSQADHNQAGRNADGTPRLVY